MPICIVTNAGPNALLRNDGQGRFTDATAGAGVAGQGWSTSAAFVDYDTDGDLDLFVLRYINWAAATELPCFSLMGNPDYCSPRNYDAPLSSVLYRNNGNGTFTDVSQAAGLHAAFGNGLGIVVVGCQPRRQAGPVRRQRRDGRTSCGSTRARAASRTGRS